MRKWPAQDAKTRFSELLEACQTQGPQLVTKRGAEAAVPVSIDERRRLQAASRPSLHEFLLAEPPRFELELPKPDQGRRQPPLSYE
jgi:antitoxin Phd